MSQLNNTYGTVTAPDTVRLERLLPGPIERVWSYLTDPELRAQWLAGGDMDLKVGGSVGLVFRNNDLSPEDDAPPAHHAGAADIHRMRGRVLECKPPHLLAITWSEESSSPSEVRFELTSQSDGVRLVITHTRLADRDEMLSVSAGWHTHIAILIARLQSKEAPAFWRTHTRLEAEYEQRLAG